MIGHWWLAETAQSLGGELRGLDVQFTSVSTDTRTLGPGALYVALRGERFDGHDFVAQALANGAVAAVVDHPLEVAIPQVQVADTRLALGRLAALNRERFQGQVAAVTGSSGKTTVKEMLAAILREAGPVLATEGNLNNDIGAPLTLLNLAPEHRFGVIELGASAQGEIAYTVGLAKPDVVAITHAGGAHLEGFGGLEGVRRAKGEILEGLSASGTAVLNMDDPAFSQWRAQAQGQRVLSFGMAKGADFSAGQIEESEGSTRFELQAPQGVVTISMAFSGRHNVVNALTAAAMASALGADLEQIKAGLGKAVPAKGRLNRLVTRAGGLLLDDTYNANPLSMNAALDVLAAQAGRLRVALLGDMAELGVQSEALHEDVGRYARARGVERVLACGRYAQAMARGFGEGAEAFAQQSELIQRVQELCQPDVVFLVKGSRSARMEQVVESLSAPRDGVKC